MTNLSFPANEIIAARKELELDAIRGELSDHLNMLISIKHFGQERLEAYTNNGWAFDVLRQKLVYRIEILQALLDPKEELSDEQKNEMCNAWDSDIATVRAQGGNTD